MNGTITLPTALTVSSDTFFYNIGSKLWSLQRKKNPEGDAIQNTAREFGFGKPTGIPIGNESKGVREEIQALSDILIKIPMPGQAESLNAGVAASIMMYEVIKQRKQ